MTDVAERVAAGAEFLDEHDPDWWRPGVERPIDLDALDLADAASCILGQRCPLETLARHLGATAAGFWDFTFKFWALAYELSGVRHTAEGREDPDKAVVTWSSCLGFNSRGGDAGEFAALTAEWKRVITGRRAAS